MRRPQQRPPLIVVALVICLSSCGDEQRRGDPDASSVCLSLRERSTIVLPPAGVRVVFEASDCQARPLTGLTVEDLSLTADGTPFANLGTPAPLLTTETGAAALTVVLVDLSSSTVSAGALDAVLDSALTTAGALLEAGHAVAIYPIAPPSHFEALVELTADSTAVRALLGEGGALRDTVGLGSRDLNGSILRGLEALDRAEEAYTVSSGTLITITAGPDQAMATTSADTASAISAAGDRGLRVALVAVGGAETRQDYEALAPTSLTLVSTPGELEAGCRALAEQLDEQARSRYLLALCSPRVGGERELTIHVVRGGATGRLTVSYDADGFDLAGCDPSEIAEACLESDCSPTDGDADGDSDADSDADADGDADGDGDSDADGDGDPPLENCNGLDDDGDGLIDEGFECVFGEELSCETTCGTIGAGRCTDRCELPSASECSPPLEQCGNGIDDDCDGLTDPEAALLGAPKRLLHDLEGQLEVAAVWNDAEIAMAWQEERGDGQAILFGRFALDGTSLMPPVEVVTGPELAAPALAWSGREYGLTYLSGDDHTGLRADLGFARISSAGIVLSTNPVVYSDTTLESPPRLIWNDTRYISVRVALVGGLPFVAIGLLSELGNPMEHSVIDISDTRTGGPLGSLDIVLTDVGGFVAWHEEGSSSSEVYLVHINAHAGTGVAPHRISAPTASASTPSLASDGTSFFVTWQESDTIRFAQLDSSGSFVAPPITLSEGPLSAWRPTVRSTPHGFVATWIDAQVAAELGTSSALALVFLDDLGTPTTPAFTIPAESADPLTPIALLAAEDEYAAVVWGEDVSGSGVGDVLIQVGVLCE